MKRLTERIADLVGDLQDVLTDPRLSSEREESPLALRYALDGMASLATSAGIFEAFAEGQVPEPGHASADEGPVEAVEASSPGAFEVVIPADTIDRLNSARPCADCKRTDAAGIRYRLTDDLMLCDACTKKRGPAYADEERQRLAALGRAHDAEVKHGPSAGEITKVCAWNLSPECLRHISGPPQGSGSPVSHGLCSSCFAIQSNCEAAERSAPAKAAP